MTHPGYPLRKPEQAKYGPSSTLITEMDSRTHGDSADRTEIMKIPEPKQGGRPRMDLPRVNINFVCLDKVRYGRLDRAYLTAAREWQQISSGTYTPFHLIVTIYHVGANVLSPSSSTSSSPHRPWMIPAG